MEALANMLIATFDLVEAEGRALHRRLVRLGAATAMLLVGFLVALAGIGFILFGLYGLLAQSMCPRRRRWCLELSRWFLLEP